MPCRNCIHNKRAGNNRCTTCGSRLQPSEGSDLVSGAIGIAVGAATDSAILGGLTGGILGGSLVGGFLGGALGDALDGDLFD